jgi:hypothetical protein
LKWPNAAAVVCTLKRAFSLDSSFEKEVGWLVLTAVQPLPLARTERDWETDDKFPSLPAQAGTGCRRRCGNYKLLTLKHEAFQKVNRRLTVRLL